MALLRLLHFPSTSHFLLSSTNNLPFPLSPSSLPKLSETCPSSSLFLSSSSSFICPIAKKPKFVSLRALSSVQDESTVDVAEPEPSETEIEERQDGKETEDEENDAARTRVLAQNVPWTSTADDIRSLFENYGTVLDVELAMHNKTRNRGLAFVTMGSHEEALATLNKLDSYEFGGRTLKLNWARPKKKRPSMAQQPNPFPVHDVFTGNLSYRARAKGLKEFFGANNANPVSASVIFHDNPRKSAGYGFVSFNTEEEAEAAIAAFQGKEFMGRPIQVARSKKFLRRETEEVLQSANAASELK